MCHDACGSLFLNILLSFEKTAFRVDLAESQIYDVEAEKNYYYMSVSVSTQTCLILHALFTKHYPAF